jgi:hypothetical protein
MEERGDLGWEEAANDSERAGVLAGPSWKFRGD